jgi:hypothetical protein
MNDKTILIKNIDKETAIGDISCCNVSVSMFSKRSILDSIKNEYATKRNTLNISADINPVANDIKKAAPYENSFQTNLCLKNANVSVEPSKGSK